MAQSIFQYLMAGFRFARIKKLFQVSPADVNLPVHLQDEADARVYTITGT
jgi:hypothetical protein